MKPNICDLRKTITESLSRLTERAESFGADPSLFVVRRHSRFYHFQRPLFVSSETKAGMGSRKEAHIPHGRSSRCAQELPFDLQRSHV